MTTAGQAAPVLIARLSRPCELALLDLDEAGRLMPPDGDWEGLLAGGRLYLVGYFVPVGPIRG